MYYISESKMDDYDNEEMAFCEESHRPGEALDENESEFLQAVFDEEDAIFSEVPKRRSGLLIQS